MSPPGDDPQAGRLRQLVAGLGVPYEHERSFRVRRGEILSGRFLLTVAKSRLRPDPRAKAIELWRELGLPESFRKDAARYLATAGFLHFGYEPGAGTSWYKVYLELTMPDDRPAGPGPMLLHIAFKWDVADPDRAAVSRYFWYPGLSVESMLGRIAAIYGGDGAEAVAIAGDVLKLAAGRLRRGAIRYLEVTEDGSPRHSYDLTLYDADLTLGDLAPMLERMARHLAVPSDRIGAILDRDADSTLGHVAGGIHRGGEDFFNVYYGVEHRPGGTR